jgi:hypothetical protein
MSTIVSKNFRVWGATQPHGKRARYQAGCRCSLCRKANTDYERTRRPNGLVSADRASAHLLSLRAAGVGYRAVAAAAGLGRATVAKALRATTKLRAETAKAILSVTKDALLDGAFVPSTRAKQMIEELKKEPLTQTRIARELGYASSLQIAKSPYITARNERRLRALYYAYCLGRAVDTIVPQSVPAQIREDVCQDILADVLGGKPLESVRLSEYVKKAYSFGPSKFGPKSLDSFIFGEPGRTYVDMLEG